MTQVSWRADDDLVERVKGAAARSGRSMNEFVTMVLDVATDPDRAGTEAERIRGRLQEAGLLAAPRRSMSNRPSRAAAEAAARRAARGSALADLVSDSR